MVEQKNVKEQLQRIGADFKFWGRAELKELPRIMFENEVLEHVINGRYTGGFATLVATSHRVILIDKKPLYLTLEDIRYDMISDVLFNHRLLDASLNLGTFHKDITFFAYNPEKLRALTSYVQQRVMEFRQQASQPQAQMTLPAEPNPVSSAIAAQAIQLQQQPTINPYKMPVMIRRRVSRFM